MVNSFWWYEKVADWLPNRELNATTYSKNGLFHIILVCATLSSTKCPQADHFLSRKRGDNVLSGHGMEKNPCVLRFCVTKI